MCLVAFFIGGLAFGQTGSYGNYLNGQYTDANGSPLSSGRIYFCSSSGACPGSQQPTYTSSSLFTQNSNPVILNGAGRVSSGGIWLVPGLSYTVVVTDQLGTVIPGAGGINIVGAAASTSTGGGGGGGGTPAGSSTYVQFNTGGSFDASGNFVFNKATQALTVTGISGTPGIISAVGFVQSAGFLSVVPGGSWQGFNSPTDGALLRGYGVGQNTAGTAGGYFDFAPITYNPNGGGPCTDVNTNSVQQPLPLNGLASFGSSDVILWNGTSPQMPPTGCGAALPVLVSNGLNTNGYLFPRGGLATDNPRYNAINTIYPGGGVPSGGVEAGAIIAGTLYPTGTVTSTTTLTTPTYLGGYVIVGSSNGPPSSGTIATVTNPFVTGSAIKEGTIYYDIGVDCLEVSNNALAFACVSSGGGSGTPGTPTRSVQFNNGGTFAGSANFEWMVAGGNTFLNIIATSGTAPGLNVATGFVSADKGFTANIATCTLYNCVQAPGGGLYALSGTFLNYSNLGNYNDGTRIGIPPLTSGDSTNAGRTYWDCGGAVCTAGTGSGKIFNGSAWVTLATGGATSPGGSNTNVQFNSGSSFGGTSAFSWITASGNTFLNVTATSATAPGVNVSTGFMSADKGFEANPATCSLYNCIQAQGGGVAALSFTGVNYIQTGTYSSGGVGTPPPLTSGDTFHPGALAWDTFSSGTLRVYDGTNWNALSGGGGGGGVAGLNTQVQFNNSSAFGASANFTWINGAQDLIVTGVSATQTAWFKNGYVQADSGFVASSSCTLFNCVQSSGASGGMLARNFTSTTYIQIGRSTGAPTLSGGDSLNVGTLYWDNGAGAAKIWNGSAYATLSTGGIASLNSLTGALNISNGGTTNQITVSPSGTTIALTLPQGIGTSSTPQFSQVTATGSNSFVSTVTGANYAFVVNGGTFLVNGNGAVTASGAIASTVGFSATNTALNSIQTSGSINANNAGGAASGAAYQVNSTTVVSAAGQWVGGAVLPVTGNIATPVGGVFAAATGSGTVFGQTTTVVIGSCTVFFQSGIMYAKSGGC